MDKKQQQSKAQYGTLTAKDDANRDYQSQSGNSRSKNITNKSQADYGTMTAKYDANGDYSQNNSGQMSTNNTQQNSKVRTTNKNNQS